MNTEFEGWISTYPAELQSYMRLARVKDYEKGDFLLHVGETTSRAFFVAHGCLRSYVIDGKGKEHILQFAPEGWVISDMAAVFKQIPAQMYIDAVENSRVYILDTLDFREQAMPPQSLEAMQQLLVQYQNNIMALQRRIMQLLSYTAEERYLEFIRIYPNMANRLPQKLIASYLGITPESLSRVRKALAQSDR